MNEPRLHLNERNFKDKMTKKGLKEWKIATYTKKVHVFDGSIIRIS